MTLTSGDPARLTHYLNEARAAREQLAVQEQHLQSVYNSFLSSGSTIGSLGSIAAIQDLLHQMEDNERFIEVIRDALLEADRHTAGSVSVADSAIATRLLDAGLTELPGSVDILDSTLLGMPPNSGFIDDPVCTFNGNFIHMEIDLAFPARSSILNFERAYNSLANNRVSSFGLGWTSILDVRLLHIESSIKAIVAEGAEITFTEIDGTYCSKGRFEYQLTKTDDQWFLSKSDGSIYIFDATGLLIATMKDKAKVEFDRNEDGFVVAARELLSGRSIRFEWSGDVVAGIETSDGRIARFQYSDGYLIEANTPRNIFIYTIADGLITEICDADGKVIVANTYDEKHRVIKQISPFGRESLYSYGNSHITIVSDSEEMARNAFVHDSRGNLTAMVDAKGYALRMRYDEHNRCINYLDRNNALWVISYDTQGNPAQRCGPTGDESFSWDYCNRLIEYKNPEKHILFEYNNESAIPIKVTDNSVTTIELDELGLPVRVSTLATVVEFAWNKDGQVMQKTVADDHVHFTYDTAGCLIGWQRSDGLFAEYELDFAGRVVKVISPDGVWEYEYSRAGRAIAGHDAQEGKWFAEFGAHGKLTQITNSLDAITAFTYDLFGNLAKVVGADGRVYKQEYDGLGQLIAMIDPGDNVWGYQYDPEGNLLSVADLERVVDGPKEMEDAKDGVFWSGRSAQARQTATCSWNIHGLTEAVDALGAVTSYKYDICGRLQEVTDALGGTTTYSRDEAGRIVTVTNPLGEVSAFHRNENKSTFRYQFDKILVPKPTKTLNNSTYKFDDIDQLVEWISPDGKQVNYQYDLGGRLVREYSDDEICIYEYDQASKLLKKTSSSGVIIQFEYDSAGRRVREFASNGFITNYRWNAEGQLIEITNNGKVTSLKYNAEGLLQSVDGKAVNWSCFSAPSLTEFVDYQQLDPWGSAASGEVTIGFNGELQIGNLVYLRARIYDSKTRVFLSPDPLSHLPGTPCSANPYHYAYNNPVRNVDPSGLRPLTQADYHARLKEQSGGLFSRVSSFISDDPCDSIKCGVNFVPGAGIVFETGSKIPGTNLIVDTLGNGAAVAAGYFDPRELVGNARDTAATVWEIDKQLYSTLIQATDKLEDISQGVTKGIVNGAVKSIKGTMDAGQQLGKFSYNISVVHAVVNFQEWKSDVVQAVRTAQYIDRNPHLVLQAVVKDIVAWDTFAKGNYAQGVGELIFNVGTMFYGLGEAKAAVSGIKASKEVGGARSAVDELNIGHLRGAEFERFLQSHLGGDLNIKVGGREFDLLVNGVWIEAKSGPYWDELVEGSERLQKFKSDVGDHRRIARLNGGTFEVHSNSPIPLHIKSWLDSKSIGYTEWR